MKQKILELLKERKEINLTDLNELLPDIKGEFSMYLPVKDGYNNNILLLQNVSKEFIEIFNYLQQNKIIELKPVNIMCYLFDGSPCYKAILFNNKIAKKQTYCWQPTTITLIK